MPRQPKAYSLGHEEFDRLLAWLGDDREQAAERYEQIRWRLITIFAARRCPEPEDLADETIDRVARRLPDIADDYVGDKTRYFFGVANNVHHEFLKRPVVPVHREEVSDDQADKEIVDRCLEECLSRFSAADRNMLLSYYASEKKAKTALHNQMAQQLGVTINTLRLRVLRMKQKLRPCLERCLQRRRY